MVAVLLNVDFFLDRSGGLGRGRFVVVVLSNVHFFLDRTSGGWLERRGLFFVTCLPRRSRSLSRVVLGPTESPSLSRESFLETGKIRSVSPNRLMIRYFER